jgi:hypothetical protein
VYRPISSLHIRLKVVCRSGAVSAGWADIGHAFSTMKEVTTAGLKATILEFSSAELTSGSRLLLEHLLLLCVCIADLDNMLLTSDTAHCCVVELLDDFFANLATLKPKGQVSKY